MEFNKQVELVTKKIPKGKVASYGMIAGLISTVRAARQVGWALHALPENTDIPWHRVLNSKGFLTIPCAEHSSNLQKSRLEKEGVEVTCKGDLWQVDLEKYLWIPKV